jgi:Holliday junction resolvase
MAKKINSHLKGSGGERELAKILGDRLGVSLCRNLEQTRGGGSDLLGHPALSIEVKRREVLDFPRSWAQTLKNAGGKVPVLAWRANRQPWCFYVPLWAINPALGEEVACLELEAFLCVVANLGKKIPAN